MADRRRRRALEDEGEEKETVVKERPSECESEGDPAEAADLASGYGSATEGKGEGGAEEESEEGSEEETEEETEEGSDEEEEDDEEEEFTDDDVIIEGEEHIGEERQSGDGEEQPDKENVDDDEDKKNPAYVPRKGAFYEHDLRTGEESPPEELPKPKKKLWQDEGKWSHDRFDADLQAPKSREELTALYGYDIRSADKPPEAPPARFRGRGRGRPQKRSVLSDFMEPKARPGLARPPSPPSPPQPQQPEPQLNTDCMVVIDTSDSGQPKPPKSRPQPHPSSPPPHEVFTDFDEDIDVPYMTTIDTTQSSADSYQPRGGLRRRGGLGRGLRLRRDRGSFEERQTQNTHQNDGYQERRPNRDRDRPTLNDRNGGRQGYRSQNFSSQDARFSGPQDARYSSQDAYSPEYAPMNRRTGGPHSSGNYAQGFKSPRAQDDFRNRNNRNMQDDTEVDYDQRNSMNRPQQAGPPRRSNRNDVSDVRNLPPRYSRLKREEQQNSTASDQAPGKREFTNSTFRNPPAQENSLVPANKSQFDDAVEKGNDRQLSQDVVISNKENVQTISVTITNTTMERKSYTKDRRGKSAAAAAIMGPEGDTLGPGVNPPAVTAAGPHPMIEGPAHQPSSRGDQGGFDKPGEKRYQRGAGPRQDGGEQNRPKRYSSQRVQRPMNDYGGYNDHQQHQQQVPAPQPTPQQHQQHQQHQQQLQQQKMQHQQHQQQQHHQKQKQMQQQQQHPPPQQQHPPPQQQHSQQQQHPQQAQPKKVMPVDSGSYNYQVYPPGPPPAPIFHPEMSAAAHPPPPPPQDPAAYSTMMPSPMPFHLPEYFGAVSGPGMPSPPRLMGPGMAGAPPGTVAVPISNASPQLLPAPYLAAPGVIYSAPPPPPGPTAQYQVPLAYTSAPPTAPPPTLAQPPVPSPQDMFQPQSEVHRGGTVYFPPYLQQPSSRSPARRQKVAIPIVDPTELKKKKNAAEGTQAAVAEGSAQDSSDKSQHGRKEDSSASAKAETNLEPAAIERSKSSSPGEENKKNVDGENAGGRAIQKSEDIEKDSEKIRSVPKDSTLNVKGVPEFIPMEATASAVKSSQHSGDITVPTSSDDAKSDVVSQAASKAAASMEAAQSMPTSVKPEEQSSVQGLETVTSS